MNVIEVTLLTVLILTLSIISLSIIIEIIKSTKKDINKCPKCGNDKTIIKRFIHDQGFTEEYWEECSKCGTLKNHWAYGSTLIEDWKDCTYPPFRYRLKHFFKNLFKGLFKKKDKNNKEDLPF